MRLGRAACNIVPFGRLVYFETDTRKYTKVPRGHTSSFSVSKSVEHPSGRRTRRLSSSVQVAAPSLLRPHVRLSATRTHHWYTTTTTVRYHRSRSRSVSRWWWWSRWWFRDGTQRHPTRQSHASARACAWASVEPRAREGLCGEIDCETARARATHASGST